MSTIHLIIYGTHYKFQIVMGLKNIQANNYAIENVIVLMLFSS